MRPSLPPEYWGILFSVTISSIVGWSIPSYNAWLDSTYDSHLV